jgi:hypothetical protein
MGDFSTKNARGVTFSELHAMTFADLDGDGIPDHIAGKRSYSRLGSYTDPDPYGPAVLDWYRTVRNPKAESGAEFSRTDSQPFRRGIALGRRGLEAAAALQESWS